MKLENVFHKFLMNMVPNMALTSNHNFSSNRDTSDDPLEKITDKLKIHPNIICINKHMTNSELTFTFKPVTKNQITKLIKLLSDEKALQSMDISTRLINEFCDFFPEFIYILINYCITEGNHVADLKEAEVRQQL